MAGLRDVTIDLRRMPMRDRQDFKRGGGYGQQQRALRIAKAYRGQMAFNAKRPERTTTQKPGTGGQSPGIGIQQQRYREIGQQNKKAEGFRPETTNDIYKDIYADNKPSIST